VFHRKRRAQALLHLFDTLRVVPSDCNEDRSPNTAKEARGDENARTPRGALESEQRASMFFSSRGCVNIPVKTPHRPTKHDLYGHVNK
jgi:hypothetical protein